MPGPRKVRVFRNPKKSPNWYVEWRDTAGRRHCESCGPSEVDAQERAREIRSKLKRKRLSIAGERARERAESLSASARVSRGEDASAPPSSVIRLHALLKCAPIEVPVDLLVQIDPELIESLGNYFPLRADPPAGD
jgi:hypothetical protein